MIPVVAGIAAFAATSLLSLGLAAAIAEGYRPPVEAPRLELAPLGPLAAPATHGLDRLDVRVPIDGAERAGWLSMPVAAAGDAAVPGVVLVHGSGPGSRDALAEEAAQLASRGVAVLVVDKRQDGLGILHRDFAGLARDAAEAAAWLSARDGIGQVGLMGWSEGGWVAVLAADAAPGSVAFVALAASPVVTPLEQVASTAESALSGAPEPVRRVVATGLASGRHVIDYLDLDVRDAIARIEQPVLAVWGADDATVPVAEAAARLATGPGDRSVLVVAGGHAIPAAQGDWLARVATWMRAPGGSRAEGVAPRSTLAPPALPATTWTMHPLLHLALSSAAAAGAATLARRVRLSRQGGAA